MCATVDSSRFQFPHHAPVVNAELSVKQVVEHLHETGVEIVHVVQNNQIVGQFSSQNVVRLIATGNYQEDVAIAQVMSPLQSPLPAIERAEAIWSQQIFEAGPLGIALIDIQSWRFLRINPAFCRMTGYTAAELLERTFLDITYPDDIEPELDLVQRNQQQIINCELDAVTYEKRYVCKNGNVLWCNLTVSLICDEKKQPLYAVGMIADISDRKHYEQELQTRETQWQLFVEHSPAAIAIFDEEVRYIAVSYRWLTDYGLTGQNIIGRCHYEVFPEIPQRWKDIHQRCLHGTVEACEEDPFPRADGSLDWVRWEVRPWYKPSGAIGGIIMFTEVITERKQAEDALRESEATNCALLNAIPDLMIRMTREGTYLNFMPAKAFKTFANGIDKIGYNVVDTMPRDFANERLHYIQTALETQTVQVYEYELEVDGTLQYEEARIAPINNEEVLVIVRDVSDRKHYETELQRINEELEQRIQERSQELYEAYQQLTFHIDNAPLGFIEWDSNFCVKTWSGRCEEIFGMTANAVVGRSMVDIDIVYPDDWPLVNQKAQGLIDNTESRQFCLNRNQTRDGRVIYCEWYNSSLSADDGSLVSIFSLVQDVTDRVQAEQALRESEKKLRLALDAAEMGFWEWDIQNQAVNWSAQVERIFGMPSGSFTGNFEAVNNAILPEDREPHYAAIQATLEQGIEFNPDFRIQRPDGEIRWLSSWGDVIRDEQGLPIRMLGVVTDITPRKQAEMILRQSRDDLERRVRDRTRELEALTERLQRSNQELEQFAYVASHDLQEPLRAVTSYTQLLERKLSDALDDKTSRYMHYIVDGAARMQQLIQDLLTYSRAGRYELNREESDLNILLSQALQNLQVAIAESHAVISSESLPALKVDVGQLTQLLQNLIGNGIKYRSDDDPEIHIAAVEETDCWQFSVRDNGIGIDPQYAERIFIIFQRLHTRREYAGTGIGLALCQKIVERHGGQIWVESQLGEGATFYFTLPKDPP
jgi:PAS domain S-box-containing protein